MNRNEHALPQARTTDLVMRELPDEMLVYDLKTHEAHCLNHTAALAWKHCDGKSSVTEIASLMEKDMNTPVDEAAVWLAVDRLSKAHLLEEQVIPPTGTPGISRRKALQRIGIGSLLIPTVLTVVAPIPAMARTCIPIGEPYNPSHDCCQPTPTTGCSEKIGLNDYRCSAKTITSYPCAKHSDCCSNNCVGASPNINGVCT